MDERTQARIRMAERIRGFQRERIEYCVGDEIYREPGRASSQANVRAGIHRIVEEARCGIQRAVRFRLVEVSDLRPFTFRATFTQALRPGLALFRAFGAGSLAKPSEKKVRNQPVQRSIHDKANYPFRCRSSATMDAKQKNHSEPSGHLRDKQ